MKITLGVSGMDCGSCAVSIEKALKQTAGVQGASVNFASSKAEVTYDAQKISVTDLKKKINSLGYKII